MSQIDEDRLRQVGRGIRDKQANIDQLCGQCGDGVVAVGTDGSVWPCVFSRWMSVGNVRASSFREILSGSTMIETKARLAKHFASVMPMLPQCDPRCGPACSPACTPQCWPTGTGPCLPKGGCMPNYR